MTDFWLKTAHEGAAGFDNRFHPFFEACHLGHRAFQVIRIVADDGKGVEQFFRLSQLRLGTCDHIAQFFQQSVSLRHVIKRLNRTADRLEPIVRQARLSFGCQHGIAFKPPYTSHNTVDLAAQIVLNGDEIVIHRNDTQQHLIEFRSQKVDAI